MAITIDGATITGGALITGSNIATDPYFPYVPLLLETTGTNGQQNNTFVDTGPYAFTITRNGTPTQGSFTPYWPNGQWSNYFAGSQSINVPASSSFQFAGDFTIECWIFRTSTQDGAVYIQNSGSSYFALNVQPSTGFNIYLNSVSPTISPTDLVPALNVWNHVALVRSGSSSGNVKVYLNGVASATTTTNTSTLGYNALAYAGGLGTGSGGSTIGYISNLRVAATAVYTSNFTPPTAPLGVISGGQNPPTGTQTKLLTCQSNRFLDNSTNNFAITVNGTPQVQAFQPFSPAASYSAATYAGSGYFNGSTDYLTYSQSFALGTNNFTLEFWLNIPVDVAYPTNYWLWGWRTGAASCPALYLAGVSGGGNTLVFYGGSLSNPNAIPTNTWTHVAIVRSGLGADNLKMYINGVQVAQSSTTQSFTYTGTQPVGANPSGDGGLYPSNVYFSNFRIVNGTAVYTAAFTPPTSPLTAITNTALLLNFTNAGIYDAAAQNDLTTVGDAQASTTQSKWSPSSMKFDGTGDYLTIPTNTALVLGTADFTIEGWVYFNTVAGAQTIWDQRPAATNGAYPVIYMNGALMIWYINSAAQITSGSLTTGVWYYFAVTRASSVTKMFINGAQVGSNYTDTNNYLSGQNLIGIANTSAAFLNGYLQDFRITRGVARTITTPTAAFPTQ